MGGAERGLLEPVPVERAVVVADDEAEGALPRPDCVQVWTPCSGPSRTSPAGALARVLDGPCARRQFRSRKAGTRKRPPGRTRKQADPDPGIGAA